MVEYGDLKGRIKHIFRFFRGELNGFYLRTICTFLNDHIVKNGILDTLAYAASCQWLTATEVVAGKIALVESDIFNIAQIGGLFNPRLFNETTYGSVWFTPSSKYLYPQYPERSERGLARKSFDDFVFVRVKNDSYATDINKDATNTLRTTLVEHGAQVLGYIAEDTLLFDDGGNVLLENILDEPPVGKAYIEWYGTKYLHMEQVFIGMFPLTTDVFMLIFESAQRVRRNGASIASLLEITSYITENYVYDISIVWSGGKATLFYRLDEFMELSFRDARYKAWLKICEMKFKQFTFSSVS